MGFAEAALLAEWCEVEIFGLDTEAGGDVAADEAEPGELFTCERDAGLALVHEPFVEPFVNGLGKGSRTG
jgi:hypothetical protein